MRVAITLFMMWVVAAGGCSRKPDAEEAPAAPGADPGASAAPVPRVTDGAEHLLFSFVDATGSVRAVSQIEEVPEAVRPRVGVTDLSLSPSERQAHRYAFFVDLSAKGEDGTYPVTTVSRYQAARGETLQAAALPAPDGAVVVYSAVWCGFCKKAKAWLARENVPFIERDVEKDAGASEELAQKLALANIRGGGVPVIDWGGTIVMGFDQRRLAALLEKHRGESAP